MRAISRAFPALCVVSLALTFTIGWAVGGSRAALLAVVWAGLVRIFLLQHVTWNVNSLCHLLGSRPFTTRRYDRATNLGHACPLAKPRPAREAPPPAGRARRKGAGQQHAASGAKVAWLSWRATLNADRKTGASPAGTVPSSRCLVGAAFSPGAG